MERRLGGEESLAPWKTKFEDRSSSTLSPPLLSARLFRGLFMREPSMKVPRVGNKRLNFSQTAIPLNSPVGSTPPRLFN